MVVKPLELLPQASGSTTNGKDSDLATSSGCRDLLVIGGLWFRVYIGFRVFVRNINIEY